MMRKKHFRPSSASKRNALQPQWIKDRILSLWLYQKNWLTRKEIKEETEIPERSVDRHLQKMVKEGRLEKEERGYKKTYYRLHGRLKLERDHVLVCEEYLVRTIRRVLREARSLLTVDEEEKTMTVKDAGLLMDLFLADFYQSLQSRIAYRETLKPEIKKLDPNQSLLTITHQIDLVLRSYANLLLLLYQSQPSAWSKIDEVLKEILEQKGYDSWYNAPKKIIDGLADIYKETIGVTRVMSWTDKPNI